MPITETAMARFFTAHALCFNTGPCYFVQQLTEPDAIVITLRICCHSGDVIEVNIPVTTSQEVTTLEPIRIGSNGG
jgi:hypothetical protein